jgi:hypothetical protein
MAGCSEFSDSCVCDRERVSNITLSRIKNVESCPPVSQESGCSTLTVRDAMSGLSDDEAKGLSAALIDVASDQ